MLVAQNLPFTFPIRIRLDILKSPTYIDFSTKNTMNPPAMAPTGALVGRSIVPMAEPASTKSAFLDIGLLTIHAFAISIHP